MAVVANPELPTFETRQQLINELAKGRSSPSGYRVEDNGWVVAHV